VGRVLSLPTLTTDRLRLEPVSDHHFDLLVGLNSDPEVMRFILGRAATPEETCGEWDRRRTTWSDEERGLGYWVGFVNDEFVGWWSASAFAADPTRSGTGYRLPRPAWGRGLATEGARAMIDHAFTVAGVNLVVASTMAVNLPSRRVLTKAGMTHVDTYVGESYDPIPGSELGEVLYELRRSAYS
jgi:RimJ/RimL family protein N-acetyltransferase